MGAFAPLQAGDPRQVGRYRIVGRLGRGGMGVVYLGLSSSGRAVAVKVVRAVLADDPGFRQRFVREVEAARKVTGVFTAAVVDAEPEGRPAWLATTYVPGVSLESAVSGYGAWPARSVMALGAALAEALDAVHGADLVHRDLKPSNVLLAADGPRVIDFGISLAAEATKLTESGVVIGTPGFISPEQLVHDTASAASDVFALGAILVYTATGSTPFGSGHGHALNYRVAHLDPDLTGLPPELSDVVERCLDKDPARRPTVPHLVEELARVSEAEGADGLFTEADWLPGPVAAEIIRVRDEPLPPLPPPSDSDSDSGGGSRATRRRILTGLAGAGLVTLVAMTALLSGGPPGDDGRDDAPRRAPARRELWSYALGEGTTLSMVVDGVVYLDGKDTVQALAAGSGKELWNRRGPSDFITVLGASDGMAYYGDKEYVYALKADSGSELWKIKDGGAHPTPRGVGGKTYLSHAASLYALESATGQSIWTKKFDASLRDAWTITEKVVYLTRHDDTLRAVSTGTGDTSWEFKAGSEITSSPVVAGGSVYFGSKDGTLHAVDTATGRETWRARFDGELWDPAVAGGAGDPIVADGVVYFENDGYVCAFTADTGRPLWRYKPGKKDVELLSVAGGIVQFVDNGRYGRTVHSLDADSGAFLWDEGLGVNATVAGGTLYFEDAGRLHAVSATG
ncbi:serine/threonine-protein kinase [Streptomyces sp. NBC_00868]|uniref:protein kinase domain-containing protein n=1 Tax=unclassified Streptomyces TaxID=2593676 RepID=UPI0032506062|nr:serine/threonine-protein kinase [Streptomyces sp. NBC_00868]